MAEAMELEGSSDGISVTFKGETTDSQSSMGARPRPTLLSLIRELFRRRNVIVVTVPQAVVENSSNQISNPCVRLLHRMFRDKVSTAVLSEDLKFSTLKELERKCRNKEQPDSVNKLTILHTTLTSVPVSIARFSNITEIVVSHNNIQELPWSMICLKQLKVLNLSHNQLRAVPNLMGYMVSLREVDLSHNCLSVIPTSFTQLIHLTTLNLAENKMVSPPQKTCDEGLDAVREALRTRFSRTNLWEKSTAYYQDPEAMTPYTAGVKSLLELAVQCVLDCKFDILSAPVPPMLKYYLIEEKNTVESRVKVGKCDKCLGYFSTVSNFSNHHCQPSVCYSKCAASRAR